MTRLYGRAPAGQRVRDSVPAGTWNTTTLIAAVGAQGAIAPLMLEGAMDGDAFGVYVQQVLAPALKPGDIVIMDNLSSHRNRVAHAAIEAAGATALSLPPYSPDFNPIEKMWSKIKTWLRRAKARTFDELEKAVKQALEKITIADAKAWFRLCGYEIN